MELSLGSFPWGNLGAMELLKSLTISIEIDFSEE
jgi:hypothetical protein